MKHVVMFSGGLGSYGAAKRVAARHGTENLTLLFCDTLMEDEDLYRFLEEAAANVGGTLVRIAEGRDPWQVFFDERYLGNTRADPCSRILKREMADRWCEENGTPETLTSYVGVDWTEAHRYEGVKARRAPWPVEAPLCEEPYITKADILASLKDAGIRQPRLYDMGFPHNNCGGFCVKAGQAHFRNLLRTMPERYRYHEEKEEALRAYLGKDVSIMRDRTGGTVRPVTLRAFRERLEQNGDLDEFEWGGCGCFVDEPAAPRAQGGGE